MSPKRGLKESADEFGELYPVLKDKDGNIIDGKHRKEEKPDWHEVTLDRVTTEDERLKYRKDANWGKWYDKDGKKEKAELLVRACETHPNWKKSGSYVPALAAFFNLDKSTIQKYLPEDYKRPKKLQVVPVIFEHSCPWCHNILPFDIKEGDIISYFDKTPPDICCPHFWELKWAWGCPFECSYCYLQGTFYGNKAPKYKDMNLIKQRIEARFNHPYFQAHPSIFNSGELSDSLMNPDMISQIADFFEGTPHRLLLLSKSSNVKPFEDKIRHNTIASFSLNSPTASQTWEHKTPPPEKRIEAAKRLTQLGYEVRIRIDPIFPTNNWKEEYSSLVEQLFDGWKPERITLGTPRALQKTVRFSKDTTWAKGLTEKTGWGGKLPDSLREEIYSTLIDKAVSCGMDRDMIAICKETIEMVNKLQLGRRCNCVP